MWWFTQWLSLVIACTRLKFGLTIWQFKTITIGDCTIVAVESSWNLYVIFLKIILAYNTVPHNRYSDNIGSFSDRRKGAFSVPKSREKNTQVAFESTVYTQPYKF